MPDCPIVCDPHSVMVPMVHAHGLASSLNGGAQQLVCFKVSCSCSVLQWRPIGGEVWCGGPRRPYRALGVFALDG